MSAEILRRAAALMRVRAEAATPGPWRSSWETDGDGADMYLIADGRNLLNGCCDGDGYLDSTDDGRHIASWHPAVALAVADWLDRSADWLDRHPANATPDAFAVARVYLGESS